MYISIAKKQERKNSYVTLPTYTSLEFHEECFYSIAGDEYQNKFSKITYTFSDNSIKSDYSETSEWAMQSGSWSIRGVGI